MKFPATVNFLPLRMKSTVGPKGKALDGNEVIVT